MTRAAGASAPTTIERLRTDGEQLQHELAREMYLSGAGHKPAPDLQAVYGRYPAVSSDDAFQATREWFLDAATGSAEHRAARMLLEWQASLATGRELAALEERTIAWESSAHVRLDDGEEIEFGRVPIEIGNSDDRRRRLAVDRARNALVASELAPLRREQLARTHEITERLGLAADYPLTFELLSGISLDGLASQCDALLRDTQAMWDDVFRDVVARELRIAPRDADRSDAQALFRGQRFDLSFPPSDMEDRILGQVAEMGLDPLVEGRVRLDTEERAGKRSRAFCAPVRIPDEVYLVVRPHGGQGDWTTFLHELGHAVHHACMRADLPFEDRWLGDNSITEGVAMLFDHRMQDPGWLRRYTSLGPTRLEPFARSAAFAELHMLRRYCAKFLYEVALHGGRVPWEHLPSLYVERLTQATSFRYDPANAFVDVDPEFYSARYLRAWQLQAVLADSLVVRFDEDWWRNPRAGPWLREEVLEGGQREDGVEVAERVAGKPLGFAPLVTAIERRLS